MTKEENKQQPALPCVPVQDNLGRIVAPIPGMNKEEYVFLHLLSAVITNKENKLGISTEKHDDIRTAKTYTNLFFEQMEKHEKKDLQIIK
jgi:hypothetical protein